MKSQQPHKKETKGLAIDPDAIIIRDISTLKKSLEKLFTFEEGEEFINGQTEISADHSSGFIIEKNLVRMELHITLNGYLDEGRPFTFCCQYSFGFLFELEDIENYYTNESNQVVFDLNIGTTLLSLAYSTARGLIYSDSENAFKKGIIMPIINPKTFLTKKVLCGKGLGGIGLLIYFHFSVLKSKQQQSENYLKNKHLSLA